MLLVTEAAATFIDELTNRPGVIERLGVRITAKTADADGDGDGSLFAFALTDGPGPLDEVLQVRRGRVYLDPDIAAHLTDKILDARRAEDGEVVFHVDGERIG